jgi:hypothetical protein
VVHTVDGPHYAVQPTVKFKEEVDESCTTAALPTANSNSSGLVVSCTTATLPSSNRNVPGTTAVLPNKPTTWDESCTTTAALPHNNSEEEVDVSSQAALPTTAKSSSVLDESFTSDALPSPNRDVPGTIAVLPDKLPMVLDESFTSDALPSPNRDEFRPTAALPDKPSMVLDESFTSDALPSPNRDVLSTTAPLPDKPSKDWDESCINTALPQHSYRDEFRPTAALPDNLLPDESCTTAALSDDLRRSALQLNTSRDSPAAILSAPPGFPPIPNLPIMVSAAPKGVVSIAGETSLQGNHILESLPAPSEKPKPDLGLATPVQAKVPLTSPLPTLSSGKEQDSCLKRDRPSNGADHSKARCQPDGNNSPPKSSSLSDLGLKLWAHILTLRMTTESLAMIQNHQPRLVSTTSVFK